MSEDAKEGFSMILKIGAALAALSAAGTAVGYNLPKIATEDRVAAIEQHVILVEAELVEQKLDALQLRWYQNQHEQEKYKQNGEIVPGWLVKEQADIENAVRHLQNRLEKN